jgi:hypothetical protein
VLPWPHRLYDETPPRHWSKRSGGSALIVSPSFSTAMRREVFRLGYGDIHALKAGSSD